MKMTPKPQVESMVYMAPTANPFQNKHAAADKAAHAMMDINADGKLSRDEWGRTGRTQELFDAYDADGDGSISEQEYVKGREYERAFASRDINGNGSLDKKEWYFFGLKVPVVNPMFGGLQDAVRCCFGCFPTRPKPESFESYDANKDGQVSAAEYVKQRVQKAKEVLDIRPYLMNVSR